MEQQNFLLSARFVETQRRFSQIYGDEPLFRKIPPDKIDAMLRGELSPSEIDEVFQEFDKKRPFQRLSEHKEKLEKERESLLGRMSYSKIGLSAVTAASLGFLAPAIFFTVLLGDSSTCFDFIKVPYDFFFNDDGPDDLAAALWCMVLFASLVWVYFSMDYWENIDRCRKEIAEIDHKLRMTQEAFIAIEDFLWKMRENSAESAQNDE